ncbi:MAG: RNA methyltransferase substrate-binding domain-containing protein [Kouleothrix sp.]
MTDLLYGRNAVREALRARRRSFQRLMVSSGAQEAGTLGEVVKLAEKEGVPVERVDRHELDRKLREANHQGAALECGPYPYAELPPTAWRWPTSAASRRCCCCSTTCKIRQNVGTSIRTAEVVGVMAWCCRGGARPR